eukprot:265507_1
MPVFAQNLIYFILVSLAATHAKKYTVSKNGIDSSDCGNETNPCGTLYKVSTFKGEYSDDLEIYVLDGQNTTEIINYVALNNTYNYDPCILKRLTIWRDVTISFNPQYIHDIYDWYPKHLCYSNGRQYVNEYLFDVTDDLKLENLIITDYEITDVNGNYPLIHSDYRNYRYSIDVVSLNNCSFKNITSSINDALIDVNYLEMRDTEFISIETVAPIFEVHWGCYIQACQFKKISCYGSLFEDQKYNKHFYLIDTDIHITKGNIYHSKGSSNFYMYNTTISTNQFARSVEDVLFYFDSIDVVKMDNVSVFYSYNISQGCYYSNSYYACRIQIGFIINYGQIVMNSIIIEAEIMNMNESEVYRYEPVSDVAFITNSNIMYISNLVVKQTLSRYFISNDWQLSINNLTFEREAYENYRYDALHSYRIIWNAGDMSSLYVEHSNFIGSHLQIDTDVSQVIEVRDSLFERAKQAFYYSGSANILLQNNRISGYGNGVSWDYYSSLIVIYDSENVRLIQNVIHLEKHSSDGSPPSILNLALCNDTYIINNTFTSDLSGKSITYYKNNGINCLSGNSITNIMLFVDWTNITSCFRPDLIKWIHHHETHVILDPSLSNQTGYFIFDNQTDFICAVDSDVTLDNLVITSANNINIVGDNSNILLVDSDVEPDIFYHQNNCDVLANDRLIDDVNKIMNLLVNCTNVPYHFPYEDYFHDAAANMTASLSSNVTKLVKHSYPLFIHLTTQTSTYYPGDLLLFNYTILDIFGNDMPYLLSTETVLELKSASYSAGLTISTDGICTSCVNGILLNTLTISENIGDVFMLKVSVREDTLYPINSTIHVNIIGCDIGYAPDSNNATCILCNNGYYNNKNNNLHPCKSCDEDINEGMECSNKQIMITKDYWMKFEGDTMVSAGCPSGLCCQKSSGCDYLSNDKSILCAANRDHESMLCGKCMDGYSESMNSSQCVKCDKQFYILYLLYPIGISILFFIFITATNTDPVHFKPNLKKSRKELTIKEMMSDKYMRLMMKIMISKNILYYLQGIAQLLSTGTTTILFASFATIFNLSIISNSGSNDSEPWCFINGLTAWQKILMDLLVPIFVTLWILLLYSISLCISSPLQVKNRKINFQKIFLASFLIIIGNILSVLLSLLNCQIVGNKSVHFYFGSVFCYQEIWILSFVSLFIILITFLFVFIKLWKMGHKQRADRTSSDWFSNIVNKYKPQFYGWEGILFIRRVIVALFSVCFIGLVSKFIFIIIMFLFLFVHYQCQPFIIHSANQLEFILLSCFIFIITTQLISTMEYVFINIMVSFFILFPFILLIFYIYQMIKLRYLTSTKKLATASYNYDNDDDVVDEKQVEVVEIELHKYITARGNNVVEYTHYEDNVAAVKTESNIDVSNTNSDNGRGTIVNSDDFQADNKSRSQYQVLKVDDDNLK